MKDPKPIRHRPRSFRDVIYARCGAKRDLQNMVVLQNKNITCPKCVAMQAEAVAKAKADLHAIETQDRKGPLRAQIKPKKTKKHYLP